MKEPSATVAHKSKNRPEPLTLHPNPPSARRAMTTLQNSPEARTAPKTMFHVNVSHHLAGFDSESAGSTMSCLPTQRRPDRKRVRAGEAMNWTRLPGTKGELLALEDAFTKDIPKGKLSILREAQATEAEFRKQAPRFEFLHLATHGFFTPKEVKFAFKRDDEDDLELRSLEETRQRFLGHHPGLLSGIVLAGGNRPKGEDDGVLTALEVAELDLLKVELAVLSACETELVRGGRRRRDPGPATRFSDRRGTQHHHQPVEGG
jgi:hypothetical protein